MTVGYTIGAVVASPSGFAIFDIVTDRLQRLHVSIPYKHTSDEQAAAVIEHAIAALDPPQRPLR